MTVRTYRMPTPIYRVIWWAHTRVRGAPSKKGRIWWRGFCRKGRRIEDQKEDRASINRIINHRTTMMALRIIWVLISILSNILPGSTSNSRIMFTIITQAIKTLQTQIKKIKKKDTTTLSNSIATIKMMLKATTLNNFMIMTSATRDTSTKAFNMNRINRMQLNLLKRRFKERYRDKHRACKTMEHQSHSRWVSNKLTAEIADQEAETADQIAEKETCPEETHKWSMLLEWALNILVRKTPNYKTTCRQTKPRNIKRILYMLMCNLNYIMRQSHTTSSRPSLKENHLQITKHRPFWAKLRTNSLRIIALNLKLTKSTNNGKKYREMKGLKSCSNHGMTRFCKEISKEHKMK